jgi:uncharacterized iron-regulated membrane protein
LNVAHRWVGLVTAAFLIIAGLTGSLLAFNHELDELLNPDMLRVAPRGAPMLTPELLARKAEEALPGVVVRGMSLGTQPGHAAALSVAGQVDGRTGEPAALSFDEVFLDPYDGRLLGKRQYGAFRLDAAHLMPFVYVLHYSLHLPGEWGLWLMGVIAILWLFDNFVGAYLTFPLKRARGGQWLSRWKPAWMIKASGSPYRVTFDLHRAGGLWLWFVLACLALSSVYLNLAREVFNPVVGLFATVTPYPEELASPNKPDMPITFSAAIAAATDALGSNDRGLTPSFILYNDRQGIYRVKMGAPDPHSSWFRIRFENVFIDGADGSVRARWGTESGGSGDYINAILFPVHSGQILALPGRILICISGLVVTMLSITGIVIWWKKRKARRMRLAREQPLHAQT